MPKLKLPASAAPARRCARRRRRPGAPKQGPLDKAAEAGIYTVDWIDERTVAVRRPALAAVPQGARRAPTGSTRWARRRCSPSCRRRSPASSWRCTTGPTPPAGLRVGPPHQRRRLPRRVRARHAQVGLVGDGDPDLPAHGPHVLLRRLQVPARAELGHRRGAADPDVGDGASPATCCRSTSGPSGRRSSASTSTASGPLVGPYLADFLRGGAEFGATTLSRFYAIHMMLVPGLIGALIGAHLYLVAQARHHGAAVAEGREAPTS